MSCLSTPLGFGVILISVSIYQGVSVTLGTSNYRTPRGKTAAIDSGKRNATVWKYQVYLSPRAVSFWGAA